MYAGLSALARDLACVRLHRLRLILAYRHQAIHYLLRVVVENGIVAADCSQNDDWRRGTCADKVVAVGMR